MARQATGSNVRMWNNIDVLFDHHCSDLRLFEDLMIKEKHSNFLISLKKTTMIKNLWHTFLSDLFMV